jgi:hypothetical protein
VKARPLEFKDASRVEGKAGRHGPGPDASSLSLYHDSFWLDAYRDVALRYVRMIQLVLCV